MCTATETSDKGIRGIRERELYLWSMLDGKLEALTAEETVGILAQGDGN